jgi:serine/threonine protein kinase/Tfp pilus assembly protein PilF
LSAFLPAPSDPDYLWVLSELVCDDLAQHWEGGEPRTLADYRDSYPELFANPGALQPVADREFQLRTAAGDDLNPDDYRIEYGVEPPRADRGLNDTPMPVRRPASPPTVRQSIVPVRGPNPTTKTAPGLPDESEDEFARIPAEQFPATGETFEGFVLKERLGRGAFAQVYLAEQVGLSNRDVALKLTKKLGKEAGRLARLQHANVVPIFSFHVGETWQAICMPYFGRQTLEDILRAIRNNGELPKSGCEVFSTVAARADSTQRSGTNLRPVVVPVESVRPTEAGSRGELRDVLTNLPYVDAAVLLVAQIADGLAHAHSLGVWHLDLKPANVLVSDHGQPMLLDFNLAFDTRHERRERFGGTIPYMAPEQLDEMIESRERQRRNDPIEEDRVSRVDELLTGRHPFPTTKGAPDALAAARAARTTRRDTARDCNPNVSPGLNAIVERLLAPQQADRYDSAAALRRDLLNHLEHKPLESVREPSVAERFAKWRARHPKALTRACAAAAVVAAGTATVWGTTQWRESAAAAARDRAAGLKSGLAIIRMDLAATDHPASRERGLRRAAEAFAAVGVKDVAALAAAPALNRLDPAARGAALDDLGEIAALANLASSDSASKDRWAALAADCFRGRATPASLGGDDHGPRSQFLAGTAALKEGRPADAVAAFERVVAAEPEHGAAQFLLAFALGKQDRHARAAERYEMAAALVPDDSRAPFNLGQIYQSERNYAAADKAYSAAIQREPNDAEAYLHRGQCRARLGQFDRAITDCDTALKLGGANLRTYALKASIYHAQGNDAAEKKELAFVEKTAPVTPADYLARGVLRCDEKKPDYDGALADFRAAADASPNFYAAWNNQAYVYDKKNELVLGVEAMNRAIDANEQSGELRLGRAVLLARIGNRKAALEDVAAGLALTDRPHQTYQAACAYALTSKATPADADKAVEFLRTAVRDGFRDLKHMAEDKDLDPIRKRDDVTRLFAAVKEMDKGR